MTGRARLPVNVYATARAGDWTRLEGRLFDLASGRLRYADERIVVTGADEDRAEVSVFTRFLEERDERLMLRLGVDRRTGPDLNLFDCSPENLQSGGAEPGSHPLGEELVDCVEAHWLLQHARPDGSRETVLLYAVLADRVLGSGIVGFTMHDTRRLLWSMGTVGYGREADVVWGRSSR